MIGGLLAAGYCHGGLLTGGLMSVNHVPGIMVTTQKRQEFQMQLMKRARRRAQKKIEYLEDDKNWKEVKHLLCSFVIDD